jgi:hypothetical protein
MARKVFNTFHYEADVQRVSQVRQMGAIEGQPILSANQWEEVEGRGSTAIEAWIDEQMKGKSSSVVLIGEATAGRKWVNYEIKKAWDEGRGLLGVYIHGLKDLNGNQSYKGADPFAGFTVGDDKTPLTSLVTAYDPPYSGSTDVYAYIKDNLADWVETAIAARA